MKRLKKYLLLAMGVLSITFSLVGCGQTSEGVSQDEKRSIKIKEATEVVPIATTPVATIVVKDYGTITIELYPEIAPNTVNNFINLANNGFYDGLIFHRIIKDFMIQGGDPDGIGTGGPGYSITGEFMDNGYVENTLSHKKGTISMARNQISMDSAGSQFFITSADCSQLDGQYAAFGKVKSGLDVVDAIQNVETDRSDRPKKDIVIESIRVETNEVEVPGVVKVTN